VPNQIAFMKGAGPVLTVHGLAMTWRIVFSPRNAVALLSKTMTFVSLKLPQLGQSFWVPL